MYVHTCTCMCVYVHTCIYVYAYHVKIHTYERMYLYVCIYVHIREGYMYTHIRRCSRSFVRMPLVQSQFRSCKTACALALDISLSAEGRLKWFRIQRSVSMQAACKFEPPSISVTGKSPTPRRFRARHPLLGLPSSTLTRLREGHGDGLNGEGFLCPLFGKRFGHNLKLQVVAKD